MSRSVRILLPPGFSALRARDAAEALARECAAMVEVREFAFDLGIAFDRARGQYLSASLLRQMDAHPRHDPDVRLIGLTEVDLYAPVLTFVFGEAQLGGSCAILSTFRLRNEFYGIPPDEEALSRRLAKEVVHEAGHLYGLIHCRTYDCVMRSSTYVEEIDLKSVEMCPSCKRNLLGVEILNNETLPRMRREEKPRS